MPRVRQENPNQMKKIDAGEQENADLAVIDKRVPEPGFFLVFSRAFDRATSVSVENFDFKRK